MKPALLAFAAAVAAAACPAAAAQPPAGATPTPSTSFPMTRAAVQQQVEQRFAARDANHDGYMTNEELGGNAAAIIGRLDADHDGKVSPAEAMARTLADFDGADADHDGIVTQAEADAIMARNRAETPAQPAQPQGN